MISLDRIDRIVLQRLLEDGRASFSAIARETKLTDVAIKKRFERLKRQNIIHGIVPELNLDVLGYGKPIYVLLKTDPGKNKQLEKKLGEMEFITEHYQLIGGNTFLLKMIVPDAGNAKRFLDEIGLIDGIREMESFMVLSQAKKTNSLPSLPFQKKLFGE